MNSSLYRLVYISKNRINTEGHTLRGEIGSILVASRRNNALADVTGALMFNNGCFAQTLEGPLEPVEETFERIQCDLRHHEIVVLMFAKISERRFSNWAMGYVGANTQASKMFAHITSESGFNPTDLAGEDVYELLRDHLLEAEAA